MKIHKSMSLFVLALFGVVSLSMSAFGAGPELYDCENSNYTNIGHNSLAYIVDGKTVFNASDGGSKPVFLGLGINVRNYVKNKGELNPEGIITLPDISGLPLRYIYAADETTGEITIAGYYNERSFDIGLVEQGPNGPNGNALVKVNGENYEATFTGEAEKIFSGQKFLYRNNDNSYEISGAYPRIRTTEEQLKCAPYLELTQNAEGLVDGFKLRFVDASNPSETLVKSAANDVWRVDKYEIGYVGEKNRYEMDTFIKYFEDGERLEASHKFPARAESGLYFGDVIRPIEDIHFIQIRFKYEDGINAVDDAHIFYEWNFYVNPVGAERTAFVTLPSSDEVAAAKVILEESGITSDKVVVAGADDVTTGATIFKNESALRDRTSSAVAIGTELAAAGDALILASSLSFPVNATSFGEKPLPAVDSLGDFKEQYEVISYLPDGGEIDLLSEFPDIFDFGYGTVNLDATIVVVDGPAPDNGGRRGTGSDVKLVSQDSQKWLIIYDGEEDNFASAEIASLSKEKDPPATESEGGSSSGCSTGALGLAIIGALAAISRRRAA
ncbi:MAG: hypothetical protein LBQ56_02870 [Synergistaceae bacterium]|jgi:MYXO-CTERM domain-containing protein|nr:hypothetical protein [Synergistaceae bacterium]